MSSSDDKAVDAYLRQHRMVPQDGATMPSSDEAEPAKQALSDDDLEALADSPMTDAELRAFVRSRHRPDPDPDLHAGARSSAPTSCGSGRIDS
jgi:hypothetical protein